MSVKITDYKKRRIRKMEKEYLNRQVSIRLSDDEWQLFKELYRDECLRKEQFISKTQFVKERLFLSE